MRWIVIFILVLLSFLNNHAQELNVSSGRLIRIENFPSQFITPRNVDIWLPDNYLVSKSYKVIYLHDGQSLFNANLIDSTPELRLDETLDSLIKGSLINDCIAVGIWANKEYRLSEYFPQKALNYLSFKKRSDFVKNYLLSNPTADNYLRFIISELKPYIDKNFPVLKDSENTFMAGTEAGALISLYALCEYPHIFNAAACIAPNWDISDDPKITRCILKYIQKQIPESDIHRVYIDQDATISSELITEVIKKLNRTFIRKKFSENNVYLRKFDNSDSNIQIWSQRLGIPLQFLFKKQLPIDTIQSNTR